MPLAQQPWGRPPSATILPYQYETGEQSHRFGANTPADGTLSQNRGYFVRFFVTSPYEVRNAVVANGITIAGNIDFGIYTTSGTRLISTGLTAHAGASNAQVVAMSYLLDAGEYYMAFGTDSSTARFWRWTQGTQVGRLGGLYTAASVIPLPASVTFAIPQVNDLPIFGITTMATL